MVGEHRHSYKGMIAKLVYQWTNLSDWGEKQIGKCRIESVGRMNVREAVSARKSEERAVGEVEG